MVRVLRYPYLTGAACLCAISCAVARDLCVGKGLLGWSRVLLVCTFVLLGLCFALLSCRFFADELGVGVGFLLRVRRTPWHELASVGVLSCNSRRTYLYGLYQGSNGFLELLHRAPGCGSWGFVVPTSRRLISAVLDLCPETIDFAPAPRKHPVNPLRPLWRQAAMYMLLLIPGAALAFFTGAMMLLRASELALPLSVVGLTLAFLLIRAHKPLPLASAGAIFGVTAGAVGALIYMMLYKRRNYPPRPYGTADIPDSRDTIVRSFLRIGIPIAIGSSVLSLINLLDNARKAMEHGGNLYIVSDADGEYCRIRVLDNGCGMPEEALRHITEAFYRVDKSRSRAQGGAGLGLTLCSQIVQLHGGDLKFDSHVGNGTCVTVRLKGARV